MEYKDEQGPQQPQQPVPPGPPPTNYHQHQQQGNYGPPKPAVPNATTVLVLGIISIVTCVCYGLVGLIIGIIALYLGNSSKRLYEANPGFYSESSFKNLSAGRTCAIVGLCLSGAYFLFILIYFIAYGAFVATMFGAMSSMQPH